MIKFENLWFIKNLIHSKISLRTLQFFNMASLSRYFCQKSFVLWVFLVDIFRHLDWIGRQKVDKKNPEYGQSNFIEITLRYGCSPVNLLHIFRTPFPKNTSKWLLPDDFCSYYQKIVVKKKKRFLYSNVFINTINTKKVCLC